MRPYTLVAELSYRCPLACAYCSNPIDFRAHSDELDANTWQRVFSEAEALGVVQAHLSGGEPLVRPDLETIVRSAHDVGLYTHLVTSGIPLTQERVHQLVAAGLDAVQLSLQGTNEEITEDVAGLRCHDRKVAAAAWLRAAGLPLTINVVIHRGNINRVPEIIDLAKHLGARRLELANVQFLGWALRNRDALMPDRDAVDRVRALVDNARVRLSGQLEIVLVWPDYLRDRPRACMGGWAATTLVVTPTGVVLPCHAAHSITTLSFPSVIERDLAWIWNESPAFQHYRGEAWMPDPCRTCAERAKDYGGCRCQAFALTGDASRTDPACGLSPDHALVVAARQPLRPSSLVLRR